MPRGQAFDTMMLVISVIVAVAILAILLGILGPLKPQFNNPVEIMKSELRSMVSAGFGVSPPREGEFTEGMLILRPAVIGDSPVPSEELAFACEGSVCQSNSLEVTDTSVDVKSNLKASIVVCGNERSASKFKYCVGLGRQADDARNACISKCEIKTN